MAHACTGRTRSIKRRTFLAGAASGAVVLSQTKLAVAEADGGAPRPPPIADNPFTLGVASGDPLDNGVVL